MQNHATTNAYANDITAGNWAATRGIAMSDDDQLRSRAIETLMCDFTVSIPELTVEFGEIAEILRADLQNIANDYSGFTSFEDGVLRIPPEGFHLTRIIACGLDAYHTTAAQHSTAI